MRNVARKHIRVEQVALCGTRYRAIRTNEAELKPKLLRDRHGKAVPASCNQNDLDPGIVSAAKSLEIARRNIQSGIDEGAIDVHCYQADGRGHWGILALEKGSKNRAIG